MVSEVAADLADSEASTLAVKLDGRVIGAIQRSVLQQSGFQARRDHAQVRARLRRHVA